MQINSLDSSLPKFIGLSVSDSPQRRGYWLNKARELASRVEVVDTIRHPLRDLRAHLGKGVRVYRASTGGKWGRSSKIVTL